MQQGFTNFSCFLKQPLVISNIRNCNVTTEILGGFSVEPDYPEDPYMMTGEEETKKPTMPYAIATLDGNLIFAKNEDVLWSLQVEIEEFVCLFFLLSFCDSTAEAA